MLAVASSTRLASAGAGIRLAFGMSVVMRMASSPELGQWGGVGRHGARGRLAYGAGSGASGRGLISGSRI